MNERIQRLRQKSMDTRPSISLDRAQLLTEAYRQYGSNFSMPMLRARSFQHILSHYPLYIGEDEWIVGEKGTQPQNAPTYPELCCHTVDDMDVIAQRQTIFFDVSADDKQVQQDELIPFWQGKTVREAILDSMTKEWKQAYQAGIFTEFMEQRAPGHTVGDDKYYYKGFRDFQAEIEAAVNQRLAAGLVESDDAIQQLRAMVVACDALCAFGRRYAEYARQQVSATTDPKRRKELEQIAQVCERVPAHRPRTFHEAIQMYWFVHLGITLEVNTWDSFSPGKLDQYLEPFYQADIAAGRLTPEHAKELLACLWIKFNNQPAPPKVGITLKESGTYTDFANINTGGINPYTGKDGVNAVSYLILEVMRDLRLTQPSSNVQISVHTPDEFLLKACDIIRDGWGQPAVYNTEMIIEELMQAGKSQADAQFGGASGCVETGAHGREAYILTGYLNVPKILELTLHDGYDPVRQIQLGPHTGKAVAFQTYDDLYHAFEKQLQHFIQIKMQGNDAIERIVADRIPVPLMSVITDDCIARGVDYNRGGARYNTRYIQCVGIGTITDALAAIRYGVFEERRFTMEALMESLRSNFDDAHEIKQWVDYDCPKYGNDDDRVDSIMQDVFHLLYDAITGRPTVFGGHYRIDMLPTTCHVYFGSVTGALPNGRLAGKPLSEGISPARGADTHGPTAVIKSCAKMNHAITGGTLLNLKFIPSVIEGDQGLHGMAALIKTYFQLGGHHIQFNVVDRQTLRDAQQHPEEHRDLIVRVAGYSDYFNNLSRALQDEIIDRTEQGL